MIRFILLQRYNKKCTYASKARIFWKISDSIYWSNFSATRWKVTYIRVCRGIDSEGGAFFQKCERAIVCSASSERSYEGIGFNRDVIVWMLKPRQMFEGTTKNTHTQVKRVNISKKDRYIYLQYHSTALQEFTHSWVVGCIAKRY